MSLTFLVFTDLHHEPQVFPHDAGKFLSAITARAETENAAFMIQLGDFLHTPENNRSLADVYAESKIETFSAFGNHDNDQESYEYILSMYRLERGYYHFDRGGVRFIVLDPNYSTVDGVLTHYQPCQSRDHNRGELPPEQLEWLGETIYSSEYPCVIFSHQSLERSDGIKNRDDVWKIICGANRRKEKSVIMCVNGHYHCDWCSFMNGVICLDLNSSSYYWTDPENSLYPKEIYERYPIASHCLFYKDPLSAVITISGDTVTVKGTKGDYICPVSREELLRLDQRRLSDERINTPHISDYYIDLSAKTIERY